MPYIKKDRRDIIDRFLNTFLSNLKSQFVTSIEPGDINYIVTRIVANLMKPNEGWGYTTISSAIRVLEDAAQEMRRRLLNPYEDEKIKENGDVPEYEYGDRVLEDKAIMESMAHLDILASQHKDEPIDGFREEVLDKWNQSPYISPFSARYAVGNFQSEPE